MCRIAIIGAGLSGRLLALNLLMRANPAVGIVMIDRGDALHMGPAYSDEDESLLLNVPAGRMGAFSSDPEHFLKWAQERDVRAGPWDFLPRRLYRDYVLDLMREAQRARATLPSLDHVRAEVVDIETQRDGARIHAETDTFDVEKVVLALGNFPPRHPPVANPSALESERYVRNPWVAGALRPLSSRDTVLLIGTGQTTVDLAVALHRRRHEGRIVAISRRGLLPLGHRRFDPYAPFFEEIKDSTSLLDIFRTVRRHLDEAAALGIDPRSVIDSLRPDTHALWLSLPTNEKRRFLRHVFRCWEVIRSRIPPESEAILDAMRASGQLEVVAGRVRDLVETGTELLVRYAPRGAGRDEVASAAFVINCIGPELDYERVEHPLVRNLMTRGLIRPGPAQLGIDSLPDGTVVGLDGAPSRILYTLGSTMKGVLWEVLAVPEIRVQAEGLARLLLAGDLARTMEPAPTYPPSS